MRFQVPQFIGVEDKIFGPLTIRQFVYLVGGGGICFILFKFLPIILAVVLSVPFMALGLALAFYQINNRPFIFFLENAFYYAFKNKLYVWHKSDKQTIKKREDVPSVDSLLYVPRLSDSKLKDLTWSLDASRETMNPVTNSTPQQNGNA
jgi:PrgI family protein